MKKSRFSDAQILAILKQAESGVPVPEVCREHGMSSVSLYKWRAKYGGMDASLMSEMKALSGENQRLKRMFGDLSMQNELLKEALGKKALRPSRRREMAETAVKEKGVSVALACRTFGISEAGYRYRPKLGDENTEIADWLVRLTATHRA